MKKRMLRCDVKNIVNELAKSVKYPDWDFDLFGCYDIIFHTVKTRFRDHTYTLDNGVLCIDGERIARVATWKTRTDIFDTESYYIESCIIARSDFE